MPMRAISATRPPSLRPTVSGRRRSPAANLAVERSGAIRCSGPSAASTSRASNGAAWSATSSVFGDAARALVMSCRGSVVVSRAALISGRDDLALEYLASRRLGQCLDDPHPAWVLVRCDLALDVIDKLLRIDGGVWFERHHGGHLLAELRVREADDGGLCNSRMLVQDLFDLPRIDVVATANDQVLLPVDDCEVAVLVDPAYVPGAEPPIGDGRGRLCRPAPISLHDVVATDHDLADLTLGDVVALLIDDPHLHPSDGGANGARLALPVRMIEGRDG